MIILVIPFCIFLYLYMIYPGKPRKHPVLETKCFAHRGLHGFDGIPENSMAAFRNAVVYGYGIELDVQLTKDDVMVVHHDYDLKRTCGVNKKIRDLTYRELKRYSLMERTDSTVCGCAGFGRRKGVAPGGTENGALRPETLPAGGGSTGSVPGTLLYGVLSSVCTVLVQTKPSGSHTRAAVHEFQKRSP